MKVPALRVKMGIWNYYISYLSFEQVNQYVKKIDDELHKSETLRELIQRSITNNYVDIKEYLLTQEERFFNALVLAVYDGDPKWVEVELRFKNEEFFNMGFLEFTGGEKIFPVDGQHRVEGIKSAIKDKNTLKSEKVAVIFISHRRNTAGMERSRRLFTTLNRYAKPVTWDDIVALDEDDSAAIITRNLLERHELFSNGRIVKAKQKAIQETDKKSFTSIITLYQCNRELLKNYLRKKKIEDNNFKIKSFKKFLKFRPSQEIILEYSDYVFNFWDEFIHNMSVIKAYLSDDSLESAKKFRNKTDGGNVLFRPVGLFPFIQSILTIEKRSGDSTMHILKKLNKIDLTLSNVPWLYVLWNSEESKMIMGSNELVKMLLIYQYDKTVLSASELKKLKHGYASKTAYSGKVNNVLRKIPTLTK
ncbi:MAG TPA: DNA sulfur modification protein DndB [Ignavibacteriaceae bacterium]|nr:DNA sulfur modification protein DndB [Ignavibacteriaceae bacterium]